ncbi:unnamed protein product [Adineta ricciae]|uniref:EF-hand domain-containing protein n=1 Tax=Adineta ricciae TaxID=249248 RepID=A0A814XWR7_ADIRI|nr:unnamed protein product [Adineta ricciae]
MTSFLLKNLRAIAIASVAFTSSYFSGHEANYQIRTRFLSLVQLQAAEYERRNAGFARSRKREIQFDDDDDDDDDEAKAKDSDDADKFNEHGSNPRERRFREFASVEYNDEIYMTPVDFLESVIAERPRPRIGRRQLTDEKVDSILYSTPPKHRGSTRFFRNLEDAGLISFSEYLFLWVILTKPHTQFEIAFAMFDTDGNQLVDKHEFLVLGKVMSDKRMLRRQSAKTTTSANANYSHFLKSFFKVPKKNSIKTSFIKELDVVHENKQTDTTLLLHFFGKNGRDTLNYTEFKRFMENLQTEVLEIEFSEFSHGFKTISDLDFTEILLRYTDFDKETKKAIVKKVKRTSGNADGITFAQYKQFFTFLNNLEEFSIAMRFHQLSNKPISQAEFQRAVKISTGFELETDIIGLIFRIFDADDDQHLSYDEFMAVMKDRLSRGYQTTDISENSGSKFEQFKRCFRERAKSTINEDRVWLSLWKKEMLL